MPARAFGVLFRAMSTALNNLTARYQTRVDALTDTDTRLSADWALETFKGAAGAFEKAAERGPVQYSISGRAFSFESKADARRAMDAARAELDNCLAEYGGTQLVDFGGERQW